MRLVVIIVAAMLCPLLRAAEPDLEERIELDGKVKLLVPKEFKLMSEEMLKEEYPSERRPTRVYTNPSGSVNIALNHTKNRMPADQLAAFHKSMEATFKKLQPSAEWFRSEIVKINGREFFVLEMRTPAVDTDIRNIICCTSLDERLLIISFNVTKELEKDWLPTAKRIESSIKVE